MSDIDNTTPGSTTPATFGVTTDQPDYAPGSTATFTATGVTVGGSVEFAVADDPANPGDDGDVDVYKRFIITDGGDGDLDGQANGTVVAQWQVPATGDATNATLDLQVTDVSTGSTAETTFTDAAGSTNKVYQHWADAGTPEWNNNILNDAKSDYFEGDVIPHIYVYKASNQVPLVNGQSYSFNITYNYYQANTNAGGFDYITTYNLSRTPGPNDATNPFIAPSADGSFVNGGGTQGVFYTVDANITNVSGVTYTGTTTKDGHVTVTFTYTGTTTSNGIAEIFFGLHVAQPGGVPDQGAGPTDGANAWTGGSLQTTVDIGGSGATSIQLAPAAIIAGEISGIKFNDVDGDGVHDAGEAGLAGWTIFIDSNNNGQLDAGEASTVTDATGAYSFSVTPDADKSDVDNDPYIIREVNQAGWTHTSADPAPILITAADPTETNVNFGNQQQNPALNITKDASVPGGTADAAGEVISYTITVQNTGNVTLTGVTVTDPYADAGSIVRGADVVGDNDALLEVGETWGYTAAHTVTQAEIDSNGGGDGLLQNTATADSNETGPDTDDASVPVAQNPALNITKDASVPGGTADAAGEVISYTITVANTGNTTLTGVTVSDPFADPGSIVRGADLVGDNDALLEVGETWGYTAAHTVTQAEIDSNGGGDGLLENTATADSNETGPDTDDASVPVEQRASLNITKDASVPGGTADAAGEVISYTITVQNTGNTTLTGVTVGDPFADPGSIVRGADLVGDNDALLEVGETWGYTAAHTVTQAEIDSNGGGDGLLENTATADSNETGPDTDDASVPVEQRPGLNIVKDVSSVTDGPDAFPGAVVNGAGDVIHYAITVQNTGNVTLTGVTVTDPYADAGSIVRGADVVGDNDALLEVGETWSYTAAHTVLQAEIDSNGGGDGQLENTATADSNETGPDTDDASVPVVFNPGVNIDKTATIADGHADQAGDIINYTVVVTNTGNVTLNNVQVTDSFEGAANVVLTNSNSFDAALHTGNTFNDPNGNGVLDVGETWTYTYQHVVTQNELDTKGVDGDGSLDNAATVTTTSPDLGPLQDDASIPILLGPGVRTPGFWAQTNWQKFWDGIVGNEPSQAGTNGFADGEITLAVVNSLGDHRVDSNGDHLITAADSATGGKITKGLLIGDLNLNGVEDGGEHAFFISTSDALSLLNANTKQLQNAEYQEGRALVATWLNYLAGNPIEAGNPAAVDAKDAIQWGVDWLLKTTKQTDGSISLTDMNANALTASSTEWNVGIDGPDAGTAPTAYATIPQYNASLDIPGGVQILGVLDEYNNHGTVYGTPIATA